MNARLMIAGLTIFGLSMQPAMGQTVVAQAPGSAAMSELVDSLRGYAADRSSVAVEMTLRDFSDASQRPARLGDRWSDALRALERVAGEPYTCPGDVPESCRIAGDHALIIGFTVPQQDGNSLVLRAHVTIKAESSRAKVGTAWVEARFRATDRSWELADVRTLGRS